jgi:putative ABC transport system permease protein
MKLYYSTQILFTAILFLSVAIALFGLLASMYTTVLERRREVVILKALGMRRADLFRMFAGEATALLLTSGTLGAVTGYVVAFLLVEQQTAIAELPTSFSVPVLPIAGMVAVSVLMGLLGAWLPTRSLLRKTPAEILRES